MIMNYEYDAEVDGIYIWFVDDVEREKKNFSRNNR